MNYLAAVALGLVSTQALAGGVEITQGRLGHSGSWTVQPIAAKNTAAAPVEWLTVECGFFKGGQLIATALNNTTNIAPGQTAYFNVSSRDADGADAVECRAK